MELCKVINIDKKKCLNCHACIMVCPVKYCITDDDTISINDNLCIGCGRCYHACPHGAINYIDDFEEFRNELNIGKKAMLIVSPAVLTAFPEKHKHLLSFLKKHFLLQGIFDEGLGAELSSILYMNSLKEFKQIPIITQQCPSVVNYIKTYHRNLSNYLAPFQSPTLILAKLIRKVFNFKDIIAYLGPCISKKREFSEPDAQNLINYNLTFESINKYIEENNLNITSYKIIDYDYIPAERGSTFCKPGGLINVIKRYYKNPNMFNIEGKIIYSKYLQQVEDDINKYSKHLPLIIDILNCKGGCYHGPAISNDLSLNEEHWYIEDQEDEAINLYVNELKAQKTFENILKENNEINFNKKYISEEVNPLFTLNEYDLKESFKMLNKVEKKDFLNCKSCGFNSCIEFASSLHFKLNNPKNCRVFLENINNKKIHENNIILEEINEITKNILDSSKSLIKTIEQYKISTSNVNIHVSNIVNYNDQLIENSDKFEPIITAITDVAEQINLLSFNASIEASRTGEIGKGFSIVASEIRTLADKTRTEIDKIPLIMQIISNNTLNIQNNIKNVNTVTSQYNESLQTFYDSLRRMNSLINELEEKIKQQ
jgi:iron only hydrogenase large subunit-like protein